MVLQAFDEIDALKRLMADLRKRIEALEHRRTGIDALEPRVAALEAGRR